MKTKICNICKIDKDISEFYINNKGKPEFCCKVCKSGYFHSLYVKRMQNPEYKEKRRKRNLAYSYITRLGIPIEEKIRIWESQNKKCEICDKDVSNFTHAKMDHNHETGQIRGILCAYCNSALGGVENKFFYKKALKYLKKYATKNNIRKFADTKYGYTHSEETKRKISITKTGKKATLEQRKKRSEFSKLRRPSSKFFERAITSKYKTVYQFDLNGNLIQNWESVKTICKVLNIEQNTLSFHCRNLAKKPIKGYRWRYTEILNFKKK